MKGFIRINHVIRALKNNTLIKLQAYLLIAYLFSFFSP